MPSYVHIPTIHENQCNLYHINLSNQSTNPVCLTVRSNGLLLCIWGVNHSYCCQLSIVRIRWPVLKVCIQTSSEVNNCSTRLEVTTLSGSRRMLKCFTQQFLTFRTCQWPLAHRIQAFHVTLTCTSPKPFEEKTMATSEAAPVEITAEPKAGQIVQHGDKIFTAIREGCAYILVPPKARTAVDPQAKSKAGEHMDYICFLIIFVRAANDWSNTRRWLTRTECILQPYSAVQS